MTDVRRIVYDTLLLAEEGNAGNTLIKDVLDKYSYLDASERSFIKRLSEGVTERRITLDHVIDIYSKTPSSKMKRQIRTLIRMGAYQIIYMDGVADHAAVNETVRLAKKAGFSGLAGFVNAVLRNIAGNRDDIPWPDRDADTVRYLSVMYSCPEWIVKKLVDEEGGDRAETLLRLSVSIRPVTARVNLSKTSVDAVVSKGYARASEICPAAVTLEDYDNISLIPSFAEGDICIQDISSMLVCLLAGIKKDDTVLDLCAAPGGKSLHAADMAPSGRIISCDVSEKKLAKIQENIERCGFSNMETHLADATVFDPALEGIADVVIADVPCSGLGVMGRKNDIKYNLTQDSIDSLVQIQRRILRNAASYVKSGGTLMFSTCTCSRAENHDNFSFLADECGLSPVGFYEDLPKKLRNETAGDGYIQLYGEDGLTDGFFIGKFKK